MNKIKEIVNYVGKSTILYTSLSMLTEGEVHCESSTTPASIVVQARLEKNMLAKPARSYNVTINII